MKYRKGVLRVSDHALLRFLERAGGIDIESFRSTVEASIERAAKAASRIGAQQFRIHADGLIYLVRDNVVVSVRPAKRPAAGHQASTTPSGGI